jgi:RNA-binding protein
MSLTGKQRRYLRGEAHGLEPVIHVGKEGLSESLASAVNDALLAHELIKVRVLDGCPLERDEVAEALPGLVKADFVGLIGRIVILYKRHPHKPKIVVPKDKG